MNMPISRMSFPPVFRQKKRDANTRPPKRINTSSLQVRLRSVRWYRLSLYWSRSFLIFMVNWLTSLERQVTSKMMLWWSYLLWFLTSISIKAQLQLHDFTDVSVFFRVRALLPANVLWGLSSSQTSSFGEYPMEPSEKTSISPVVCFLGIPFSW